MHLNFIKIKRFCLKSLAPAALIVAGVLFFVRPVSCKSSVEGLSILEGDFTVPQIEDFTVDDSKSVSMKFSKAVELNSVSLLCPCEDPLFGKELELEYQEENKSVCVIFPLSSVTGNSYVLEGSLTDSNGNTLSFSIPFTGYNDHPALVKLSEVRNCYTKVSRGHKCEFVELYVEKSGNLCGLEIETASDGEKEKFVLPAIEVSRGEFIVCHMRKAMDNSKEEEGQVSETGSDLDLAEHIDSCDGSRDLWNENTSSVISDKIDAIVVRNSFSAQIIDAVVFAKDIDQSFSASCRLFLDKIEESGVWGKCDIENTFVSSKFGTGATYSLSRIDYTKNGKSAWIVAKNATPGLPNCTESR